MSTIDQQVAHLVAQGQLSRAIKLLCENNYDGALQLSARLNTLEQKERMGTISLSDASVQRSQITDSALSLVGIKQIQSPIGMSQERNYSIHPTPKASVEANRDYLGKMAEARSYALGSLEDTLRFTDKESELERLHDVLTIQLADCEKAYLRDPLYDLDEKAYKAVLITVNKISAESRAVRKELNEKRVREYVDLCKQEDPSWDELNVVYAYARSLGFNNHLVAEWIQTRPNDIASRRAVANILAIYVSS